MLTTRRNHPDPEHALPPASFRRMDPRQTTWDNLTLLPIRWKAFESVVVQELAKTNLLPFIRSSFPGQFEEGWFHRVLTDTLDAFMSAVQRKSAPRLMTNAPPRHGKSLLTSVYFPAFILGCHPDWDVVCATYGQDLANDLGRDVRNLLNSSKFKEIFGNECKIDRKANALDFVATEAGGSYSAVSVGGALTGRGCHVLIIDDPHKDRAESESETIREQVWRWYQSVATTRLTPGGGIIVMQTRWHEDDLTGRILARSEANADGYKWEQVIFQAIADEDEEFRKAGEALHEARYSLKELERKRAEMDSREWNALYQQNPVPDSGDFFEKDWLQYWKPREIKRDELTVYITCDLSIGEKETNDYTVIAPVGITPHDDMIVLPDLLRKRLKSFDIVEAILDAAERYNAAGIVIEREKITMTLMPLLQKRMQERGRYFAIHDPPPTKDKTARARPLQGRMQQRKVFFPDSTFFRQVVVPEFMHFPAGKHDDMVDALATLCSSLPVLSKGKPKTPPPPSHFADTEKRRTNPKAIFAWQAKPKTKLSNVISARG